MNPSPNQGLRILLLVRSLAGLGLLVAAITLGMVGWMLKHVRSERSAAVAEQFQLEAATEELRDDATESRAGLLAALDETSTRTIHLPAVTNLAAFVSAQRRTAPLLIAEEAIERLQVLVTNVAGLSGQVISWRAGYLPLWEDLHKQTTLSQVRALLSQMRLAIESVESRRRLDDAIRYRRWRKATGEESERQAQAILAEMSRAPLQDASNFKGVLTELACLVETLNGEEQFDNLSDLKNNKLKPVLDRMSRSSGSLAEFSTNHQAISAARVEALKTLILGGGPSRREKPEASRPSTRGLFALRHDVLQMRRERERLKNELNAVFLELGSAIAQFAQAADTRTAALSLKTEQDLAAGWRNLLLAGVTCSGIFIWLAWLISRGINGQVSTIETSRAEAEASRRETHALMVQHQAINAVLDRACILAVTDVQGTIREANDNFCYISGYLRDELIGQNHRILKSGEHPEGFFRDMWRDIARGNIWHGEIKNRAKDGTYYWMDTTIGPLLNEKGKLRGYLAIRTDITERKAQEAKLAEMNKQLVETSRHAGMAEVATGVLHNVGNVLNSVNVSATLLNDLARRLPISDINRVVGLLREQGDQLGAFFTKDPRGPKVIEFLAQLAVKFTQQQEEQLSELTSLTKNVEHIKDIVAMQQSYARVSGVTETVDVGELVEDTLRMNAESFQKHGVKLVRDLGRDVPAIVTEKHKVLQILVNLVRNAKHACEDTLNADKQVTVRTRLHEGRVRIQVIDNGVGIAPENLTRVFNHGFTTKKNGHGFGLHSGANAAKELGGSLTTTSDGPGTGATFTLELPPRPPATPGAAGAIPPLASAA